MTSMVGDFSAPQTRFHAMARTATVWLFIAVLAWSPFPLGGAISWGAGLQEILVALCWISWVAYSATRRGGSDRSGSRAVIVPLALAVVVLIWACVQMLPGVPSSWIHPAWSMASDAIGRPVRGAISLNPWRTEAEILKLASYVMACWLAFRLARHHETAAALLNAIIAITAAYALYAFVLRLTGFSQTELFYITPLASNFVLGPFVLHNSFATYSGLGALAAVVKLFAMGSQSIAAGRGGRQLLLTILQFCFGRGAFVLVAVLLTFAGVVASASRAGFAATMCGVVVLALASLLVNQRGSARLWAGAGALIAVLPLLFLIVFSGDTLADRIGQLLDSGVTDSIRTTLWAAANRMIADAPLLGLGLGTFQDAYPLYATQVLPYVMDKAHCDYLEFAAGLGLPAAIAWWSAMAWMVVLCLRGVRVRHRHRLYPVLALGATALVGVHSSVDFSLQMPAVALLYATILGLGTAQALPSHHRS